MTKDDSLNQKPVILNLQNLILKCLTIVSYMGNELRNNRLEGDQQKLKTILKKLISFADSALLLGKANQNLLAL